MALMFPQDGKDQGRAAEENQRGLLPFLGLHLQQEDLGGSKVTLFTRNPNQSLHLHLPSLGGIKVMVAVIVAEIEEEAVMPGTMIL